MRLSLGISLKQYSILWTINGLLIVLVNRLLSQLSNGWSINLKAQIIIGIVIFVGSFIVVAYAGTFKMFIVSMIILTFGEMFVWPAIPTLASQLAPKGREGFYQGIVNSTATIGRMIGPFAVVYLSIYMECK